jgi:3-keto-5-aminohexanoate cleavage enzyme
MHNNTQGRMDVQHGKLIINVALTGIVPTKSENPHLPVTPVEIAEDARRVCRLGASILHVHARDEHGRPTHRKEIFGEIIARIREHCPEVVITATTSGRRVAHPDLRFEVLELQGDRKPDMASLMLGSLNFLQEASINPPEFILRLLGVMNGAGVRPELEILDTGMANYAGYLYRKGFLEGPCFTNLILGSIGTMPATPRDLVHLTESLPPQSIWAATGVGRFALPMQRLGMAMGGHVRVGLEDSVYMNGDKREPATNEKLVSRVVRMAEAMERELATPREVRRALGLEGAEGQSSIG